MEKKRPYCLMPWIHLHVAQQGRVQACCVANIPYGNINEQSLTAIWEGEAIEDLRAKFARGEKDSRCAVCFKMEAAGGKSIRQETFEKFESVELVQAAVPLPIYFDIRFSNVCNFRCRTCWHGASSKWFNDAMTLGRAIGTQAILKNVLDFNDFIEKTGAALLQAEEIYFAGGEPLVMEEHYLLLEWLLANGANGIRLRYNTNFSRLQFKTYKVLDLWAQFPEVEVMASIDATGDLGEYIRKDLDWEKVLVHREMIRELPHVQFKIAPTVSILNLHHLPTLYKTSLALGLIEETEWYINILERPNYYNIQAFPVEYKKEIQVSFEAFFIWLTEQKIAPVIREKFQECLDYMFARDQSKHWLKFLVETELLDNLREESIHEFLKIK
ncbi:MAG: twitch domain-containing radical SAM protein [Saprospiraceae bacterium]